MAERVRPAGFALGRALLLFAIAYVLMTVLASAISVIYGMVVKPPPAPPGSGLLQDPAFVATVPYHVLIMCIFWPLFAGLYFLGRRRTRAQEAAESWRLSFLWLAAAVIADFVGFVWIKHAWSLTPREFYVEYQPWITLIYGAIFLSPWIRLAIAAMLGRRASALAL